MRIFVGHPGVTWSTSDVYDGLTYGLIMCGHTLVTDPRYAHVSIVVTGIRDALPAIDRCRAAGPPVAVLFTESPYDLDLELPLAAAMDAGWTQERASLSAFQDVNPATAYLPHAWHPERHYTGGVAKCEIPAHDVVIVGSGFPERVAWLNAIDWSGIDLGLYGIWDGLGLREEIAECIAGGVISNAYASALYRRARMGINLYRTRRPGSREAITAESLNPRAYELAACGTFHLSTPRAEVDEIFGGHVPTYTTPDEAEIVMRAYLDDADERQSIAAMLPQIVADDSWVERAAQVVADVRRWNLA